MKMDVTMGEPGEILPEHTPEKSPYEVLQESKASVMEIVSKMLSMKKESTPKSEIRELVTQIFINFVSLRQANRSILLEEDRVKGETERAKAPVDFTTLQLHNLMYEKSHYVKAIKACKDFRSKHPDIELVPEEEFFRDAPEEIKNTVMSNDNSHNLMLKRFNFELFQRKELCKLREKLEQKKKALQETIANRKKFLSSLPSHLKSLKKASLPVQHQLGVLHTKKLKQVQYAELLPPPLYVIYSQLMAQKEAFGEKVDLEIVGSVKDAQAVARQQANKDTGVSASLESSKVDDDIDEEDDGQRRRKRPKKIPSKESLEQAGIYQTHPLKVTLHIHDDEKSDLQSRKLVTLKFEYLIKLNCVCVGVEGSQENADNDMLCNLFPDDTGLELPIQSAKLINHSIVFDERRTSRPYKWAQHLAGIDFLPEVSPLLRGFETSNDETSKHTAVISGLSLYRQQNRVQTVVQRVRARKKAQLALVELFDSLMKLNWPALASRRVPWASHDPRCILHAWFPVGSSPSQVSSLALTETEQVQHPTEVVVDGNPASSKEEVESTREDGELPSLVPATSVNDINVAPIKRTDFDHSAKLAFISKSTSSPITKGKSPSFKKYGDDTDLILESDGEMDDIVQIEQDSHNSPGSAGVSDVSWVDKVQEYCLVLTRKMDNEERKMKLEAKIKISREYPLRPPLFTLSLYEAMLVESYCKVDSCVWYNELRSMEAEVNVHILNAIPAAEENLVLAHQVRCLALLFDFYVEDGSSSSEKRRSTSVIDVGLCKPMTGQLLARSFRGRDHRKMISWKDGSCTPGYPY